VFAAAPASSWLLRLTFPGLVPAGAALPAIVAAAGLHVVRAADHSAGASRWLVVGPHSRRDVDAAIEHLTRTHRISAHAIRNLSNSSNPSNLENP
jgi:hypothetical protein